MYDYVGRTLVHVCIYNICVSTLVWCALVRVDLDCSRLVEVISFPPVRFGPLPPVPAVRPDGITSVVDWSVNKNQKNQSNIYISTLCACVLVIIVVGVVVGVVVSECCGACGGEGGVLSAPCLTTTT